MFTLSIACDDSSDLLRVSTIVEIMLKDENFEPSISHVIVATDWYLQQLVTSMQYNMGESDKQDAMALIAYLRRATKELEDLVADKT